MRFSDFVGILLIFLIVAIVAFLPTVLILGPKLFQELKDLYYAAPPPQAPAPVGDEGRYFDLKAASCRTLSKDFLIATSDLGEGEISGLVEKSPETRTVANLILNDYRINNTLKVYSKGDELKVVQLPGENITTIWKGGRIYNCTGSCNMHLTTGEESATHSDLLYAMRHDCAYFGTTPLPPTVNISRLLNITRTGALKLNGYDCDNFLITGDRDYVLSLLTSQKLDNDQRALLFAIAHFASPMQECLDQGTGVIVYRNITLDLTDAYRFNYEPGGYMRVNQQTKLVYYTDNVPESFLSVPS